MLKVRQKTWNGNLVTESVTDAVRRELAQAGGHGYGQVEQLKADIEATQEILLSFLDVLGPSLDRDDIFKLLGRTEETARHDKFEVIEGED